MAGVAEIVDEVRLGPAEFIAAWEAHEQRVAVLALAARRLETMGEWAADGSVSMAAWLRSKARMSGRDANRLVRRGRFLDRFASIADAAVSRQLSAGQVDALLGVYRTKHEPVLAEQQAHLVAVLAPLTVDDTERACQVRGQRADAIADEGKPPTEPERSWTMTRADDGALVGRFVFDDALASECEKAIANAMTYEGASETRVRPTRQGDAMFRRVRVLQQEPRGRCQRHTSPPA